MEEFFKKAKREVIETLYSKNAIKWNLKDKFQLKSGVLSPMFCNAGVLENTLETRGSVISAMVFWLGYNFKKADAIVGMASGGISWATSIANSKGLDFLRAHARPKEYGLLNQFEGELPFDGAKVIVIDDIITTGKSVLNVVNALHEGVDGKKAEVLAVFSIFDWDFPHVNQRFEKAGVKKYHIISFEEVLAYGFEHNLLPEGAEEQITQFRKEQDAL